MKLKTCPFCGEKPLIQIEDYGSYIFCDNPYCPADDVEVYRTKKKKAKKAWNTRSVN